MTARFSLAHLTVLSLAPPEVVQAAARTGYETVGLRLLRVMQTFMASTRSTMSLPVTN